MGKVYRSKRHSHVPDGTCNAPHNTGGILLQEHKLITVMRALPRDVALWAHTVDLRQATIPGIAEQATICPAFRITLYSFTSSAPRRAVRF